jgi:hypothetical protein
VAATAVGRPTSPTRSRNLLPPPDNGRSVLFGTADVSRTFFAS